jgi:hypothetical protein
VSLEEKLAYAALATVAADNVVCLKCGGGFDLIKTANLNYCLRCIRGLFYIHNFVIEEQGYISRVFFTAMSQHDLQNLAQRQNRHAVFLFLDNGQVNAGEDLASPDTAPAN